MTETHSIDIYSVEICGIIHNGGRNGEPLACGFLKGHSGNHAWATLPTFTNGETKTEHAANAVLDCYGEFGEVIDGEYMNALFEAHKADMSECHR